MMQSDLLIFEDLTIFFYFFFFFLDILKTTVFTSIQSFINFFVLLQNHTLYICAGIQQLITLFVVRANSQIPNGMSYCCNGRFRTISVAKYFLV